MSSTCLSMRRQVALRVSSVTNELGEVEYVSPAASDSSVCTRPDLPFPASLRAEVTDAPIAQASIGLLGGDIQ